MRTNALALAVALALALVAVHSPRVDATSDTCFEPAIATSAGSIADGAIHTGTIDATQCAPAEPVELHSDTTLADNDYNSNQQSESESRGATDAELHDLLVNAKAAVAALGEAVARLELRLGAVNVASQSTANDTGDGQQVPLPTPASTQQRLPGVVAPTAQHAGSSFTTISEGSAGSAVTTYQSWQRLVAKGRHSWPEYFSLVAAVKADAGVTAMHSMFENPYSGRYRYLLLGDESGRVYILSPQAEVLREYSTGSTSPVTAIMAYTMGGGSLDTLVATGHLDGELRHHIMVDSFDTVTGTSTIDNITLIATVPHPYTTSDFGGQRSGPPSILLLDAHKQQLGVSTVVVDSWGSHRMVLPDGSVRFTTHSNASILAARKGKTVTALASDDGIWVGVAPPYAHVMRKLTCQPLNGSRFLAAAFDVVRPYLLYAVTDAGQLLTLLAPTDNRVETCTVWAQRPLALPPGAFKLVSIKSYLLLAHQLGVAVFNVTPAYASPPEDVLIEPISNIASMFGRSIQSVDAPLAGGSQAHMLALHFGDGLVAIFTNSLPVYRPPNLNLHLWSKPIFIVVMILVGVWTFNRSNSRPDAARFGAGPMLRDRSSEPVDAAAVEALIRRMQAEDSGMIRRRRLPEG